MCVRPPVERRNELLRSLSHQHRRHTLRFLAEQPTHTTTVDELVDHLAGPSERGSLSVEMVHLHLPKLETAELIEWDRRSGTIRYRPDGLCERLLETMRRHDAE